MFPGSWFEWVGFLRSNAGSSEAFFVPRIAIGVALIWFGAVTDRRWLVPVAVWFTLPHVWASSWVILLGVIRLHPAFDRAIASPDMSDPTITVARSSGTASG
jgi:hypothetical protein